MQGSKRHRIPDPGSAALVLTVFDLWQADVHGAAARHQVHGVANIHPLQLWRQPAGGVPTHQTFQVSLLALQDISFKFFPSGVGEVFSYQAAVLYV